MTELAQRQGVLVIAAHPDDEILGCGGSLALHAAAGDHVTVVIAAEGRPHSASHQAQRSYTESALKELGVHDVRQLGFPDQRLDTYPLTTLVERLETIVEDVTPGIVYCQFGGDINRDHQVLFKAALVATRPTMASISEIYAFDTASSTEWGYPRSFVPDTWVDISRMLDTKLAAMAHYASEVREYPHPRSLDALRHRAIAFGNQCCLSAAEVFMTIRRVRRDVQADS